MSYVITMFFLNIWYLSSFQVVTRGRLRVGDRKREKIHVDMKRLYLNNIISIHLRKRVYYWYIIGVWLLKAAELRGWQLSFSPSSVSSCHQLGSGCIFVPLSSLCVFLQGHLQKHGIFMEQTNATYTVYQTAHARMELWNHQRMVHFPDFKEKTLQLTNQSLCLSFEFFSNDTISQRPLSRCVPVTLS